MDIFTLVTDFGLPVGLLLGGGYIAYMAYQRKDKDLEAAHAAHKDDLKAHALNLREVLDSYHDTIKMLSDEFSARD